MGYVPSPASAWAAIRKLPAGSFLLVTGAAAEPQRYWSPEPAEAPPPDEPQLLELLRCRLAEAVKQNMAADVPIGALLSGGVDSSIIVALMCRDAGAVGGVRTFTAGFSDSAFDERPDAARVAKHCGTDHTELLVRPRPEGMLEELLDIYDEPFGDSSALPTLLLCREARKHVGVALAGDGGDEVFGGYDRYRALRLAETMSPPKYLLVRLVAAAGRLFAPADERSRLRRFLRFADSLSHPPSVQYFMYRSLFGPADLARLFTAEFAASVDLDAPAEWFCQLYEEPDAGDEVVRAQRHDMLSYLPDDLLVKTDMASMAASLELRAPMLDHGLASLGLSLPAELKVGRRRGKLILRRAFADMLPPETLRRGKQGFGVPLGRWLKEELGGQLKDILLDPSLRRSGIFKGEAIAGLINDHVTGRADHRHRLWALLVLARWMDRHGGLP
jgi:asparagine synthase (glutamine-hydrolysing)